VGGARGVPNGAELPLWAGLEVFLLLVVSCLLPVISLLRVCIELLI